MSVWAHRLTARRIDHFPVVPTNLFFRLILREHPHGSWLGTPTSEPVAPTKLAFGWARLAIRTRAAGAIARADREMFAPSPTRVRDAKVFALASIANRRELLCFANQLA